MTKIKRQWTNKSDRYFFSFIALVFITISLIGFSPSFYFSEKAIDFPLPIIIHGILFSIWILFFFLQTLLIGSKKHQLHSTLGKWSILLMVILVVFAVIVACQGIERNGSRGFGNMIQNIILFTGFFSLGLIFRRRADWHKRFMVFSIYSAMTPAILRMQFVENIALFLILSHLPIILLIIYDIWLMRKVNKATIIGVITTFVFSTIAGLIYSTEWWDKLVV